MLLALAILAIVLIYLIIALSPLKICAICTAVSLTWLGILIAYFLSWHQDILLAGILMGGSIVGFMYRLEHYFKNKHLSNFWLIRILLIGIGFPAVYVFLLGKWEQLIFIVVAAILVAFGSLFIVKNKHEETSKSKDGWAEKLEHCCD